MSDTYTYKVRDKQGQIVEGTLESDSTNLVANKLRQMGYVPLAIDKKATGGVRRELHLMKPKIKLKDIAVFSRQFAVMIDSGLSLLRALSILEDQIENKALAKVMTEVRSDVEKGSALSQALAKHPKAFNRLYVSMVRRRDRRLPGLGAGAAGRHHREAGRAAAEDQVGHDLPRGRALPGDAHRDRDADLHRAHVQDALRRPGGTLPLPARLLLLVSSVMVKAMPIVIIAQVGAVIAFKRWIATDKGRGIWDAFKLKVPVFGKLVQLTALARFSRTLASLLRSGVPLLESLEITSGTVGNTVVSNAITDMQDGVKQGEAMVQRLGNHSVFPTMVVQMISVGEETGAVDTMLDKIGEFYEQEIEATVDALTSLLEPALIVVLGGCVGGMVVSLYMPMFNIIKLIQ